ncbi:hypothetical protein ACFS6H_16485 [Terrimonas rubra]|uniref:Uncharacterized protein n=1 Tax=Terrimonas rubra TaxID=1035890 RepID=A0ABW6A8Q5_9BACT
MFQRQLEQQNTLLSLAYIEELFRLQFPNITLNSITPFWSLRQGGLPPIPGVYYYGYLAIDDAYNNDGDVVDSPRVYNPVSTSLVSGMQQQLGLWPEIQNTHSFIGWKVSCVGTIDNGIVFPDPPTPDPSDLQKLTLINHFWINETSHFYFPANPVLYLLFRAEYLDDVIVNVDVDGGSYSNPFLVENGYVFVKLDGTETDIFEGYQIETVDSNVLAQYTVPGDPLSRDNLPFIYRLDARFTFPGNPEFRYTVSHIDSSGNIIPGTAEVLDPTVTNYNAERGAMIGVAGFNVLATKNLGDKTFDFNFKVVF